MLCNSVAIWMTIMRSGAPGFFDSLWSNFADVRFLTLRPNKSLDASGGSVFRIITWSGDA
jgi:hypothetical protein